MEGINCNGEGGWTRVGYVNMAQPGATCPDGLIQKRYININYPLCSRPPQIYSSLGCISTTFNTLGLNYSNVCGKVRGYQYGSPDSFRQLPSYGIDGAYVEGVSITHGKNPRKNIWTYAAAFHEDTVIDNGCPCSIGYRGGIDPTSTFIGSHYYCESGLDPGINSWGDVLFVADPLWDGKQCDDAEATCCPANSKMPWFYHSLGTHTSDGIELRLCGDSDEDTPLDIIELYVM